MGNLKLLTSPQVVLRFCPMTAPAVSFDEWLTDHLDEIVDQFHHDSRDDCLWLFLQYAHSRYAVYLYGVARVNGEISEPEAA